MAKMFGLLYGLAEGNGAVGLELVQDTEDNGILEIGKVLEAFAAGKEPSVLVELLPCTGIHALGIEYLTVVVVELLTLCAGDKGMDLLPAECPELGVWAMLDDSLGLWVDFNGLGGQCAVEEKGKKDDLRFGKNTVLDGINHIARDYGGMALVEKIVLEPLGNGGTETYGIAIVQCVQGGKTPVAASMMHFVHDNNVEGLMLMPVQ